MSQSHDGPTPTDGSPQGTDRKESSGCPVAHDGVTSHGSESENPVIDSPQPKGHRPHGNRDWWPNQLDLAVLHPHHPAGNPLGADFRYSDAFASLDVDALSPREALDLLYELKREAGTDR